jgi:ribonuclease R
MREISRHISDTERTSAEAEAETKQIKLFDYLSRVAEMHDPHIFHGLVTDVRPMGLMVEVPDMGIRGVVKREDLPAGRWRLEAHRMAWVSTDGIVIQLGMRVPLTVTAIDREKRFVDFSVAGPPTGKGIPTSKNSKTPPAKKHAKKKIPTHSPAGPTKNRKPPGKSNHRRRH